MKEVKCEKTMSCAPGFVWSWDCCCCTGWSGPINNLIEGFGTELKSPVSRYGCEKTMECAKGYKWSWTFCRCIVDGMPGPANKIAQGGILELNNPVTHLDGRRGEENPFTFDKENKKCWTCTPQGNWGGCVHSGSIQGERTSDCLSWWECTQRCQDVKGPGWPLGRMAQPEPVVPCQLSSTINIETGEVTIIDKIFAKDSKTGNTAWIENPTAAQVVANYLTNPDGSPVKQLPKGYLTRCGETPETFCPGWNEYTEYIDKVTNCDWPDTVYVGHMPDASNHTQASYWWGITSNSVSRDGYNPPEAGSVGGNIPGSWIDGWTWALPRGSSYYNAGGLTGNMPGYSQLPQAWPFPIAYEVPAGASFAGWYASNWTNLTKNDFLYNPNMKQKYSHGDQIGNAGPDPTGDQFYCSGGIGSKIDMLSRLVPCNPIVFSTDPESRTGMGRNYGNFQIVNLNSQVGMSPQGCDYGGISSILCPGYSIQGTSWLGAGINNDAIDRVCHLPWPAHSRSGQQIAEDNGYGDFPLSNFISPGVGNATNPSNPANTCYTSNNLRHVWWFITGTDDGTWHPTSQNLYAAWGVQPGGARLADVSDEPATLGVPMFRPYPQYPIDPALPLHENATAFKNFSDAKKALFEVHGPANWPDQRLWGVGNVHSSINPWVYNTYNPPLWIPTPEEYRYWGLHDVIWFLRVWVGDSVMYNAANPPHKMVARIDWQYWNQGSSSQNIPVNACWGCCQDGYKGTINHKKSKVADKPQILKNLRRRKLRD